MNNNEARSLGKEDKHSKVCKGYPNIKEKTGLLNIISSSIDMRQLSLDEYASNKDYHWAKVCINQIAQRNIN